MGSHVRPPEARLLVTFRSAPILELPLEGSPLWIGSGESNDLRLRGSGVQRDHLVLRRRGRRWIALARQRALLVSVSGKTIRQLVLCPGVRVGVGDFWLEVVREASGGRTGTETLAEISSCPARPEMGLRSGSQVHPLCPSGILIGRDPSSDIVLDDPYLSLQHARVQGVPGGWAIVDLGSRNGTRVDGHLVDGAEIGPGSLIVLGRTVIECVSTGEGPGEPTGWLETPGLLHVLGEVDRCATTSLPVMLVGESGVGKEGLARRIHARSARSTGPFVPVNCGALPEGLSDSILFGHVRGAFTGAHERREGLIQASSGGTLFLDEVGELPPSLQARLLRVLEENAVRPLGSTTTQEVDVRIVSATHRHLPSRVADGSFRLDLLHRLAVLTVVVPPLRERPDDIDLLAPSLLVQGGLGSTVITPEAMSLLRSRSWPGNVRELRNVLLRAAVRAGGGVIQPSGLVFMEDGDSPSSSHGGLPATPADAKALLSRAGGNISRAAREIGVARSTLRGHLRRLGVPRRVYDLE